MRSISGDVSITLVSTLKNRPGTEANRNAHNYCELMYIYYYLDPPPPHTHTHTLLHMQEQQEIDKRQSERVLSDVQRLSWNTVCSGDLLVGVVYILFNMTYVLCVVHS